MEYVFPHYKPQEKIISKIQGINRLFAYPTTPHTENNGNLVILDSGAYGLSLRRGNMNLSYMRKLSEHYATYANNKTLCIAPDVFENPMETLENLKKWNKYNLFPNIVPVLQNSQKYIINRNEIKFQIDYYARNGYKKLCFSINKTDGKQVKTQKLEELLLYAKTKGIQHIHCLGAGWNIADIRIWKTIKGWDTMDSIAYYNEGNPIENIKLILKEFEI